MRLTRVFAGVIACVGLLSAETASAYVVRTLGSGAEALWASPEVTWHLDPDGSDDIPLAQVHAAIASSLATWQAVNCSVVSFVDGGTSATAPMGALTVSFEEDNWDPSASGTLAVTINTFDSQSGEILKSEIEFNGVFHTWGNTLGADLDDDIETSAVHEVGHALGLRHSRERDSAMFFQTPATTPRALHVDDGNGACYLYPTVAFASGVLCDTCTQNSHCAAGDCVANANDGASFCGADCNINADCPDQFVCTSSQCAPEFGFCTEVGGTLPILEYCWGSAMCQAGLFCHSATEIAYCTKSCVNDGECPAAAQCVSSRCALPGTIGLGEPCGGHTDCTSLSCITFSGQAYCTDTCVEDGDCAAGQGCLNFGNNLCVNSGAAGIGEGCGSHLDCATLRCTDLNRPGGPECTDVCTTDADCNGAGTCLSFGPTSLCVAPGPLTAGGDCSQAPGSLLCETLICSSGTCTSNCSGDGDCDSGCTCQSGKCKAPGSPPAEICDNQDQNCNGAIDEGFGVGDSCATGDPSCPVGVTACGAGGTTECVIALDCDDDNPCTEDACDPGGGCANTPTVCDDGNACTTDSCDPATGCVALAVTDGLDCSSGDGCNGTGTCQAGACVVGGGLDCDDQNPCTTDSCSGGVCSNDAVANDTTCADADLCDGAETCQSGACTAGATLVCDDGEACTTDSCVAATGCATASAPNGTSCDDGDVCNGNDTCNAGACQAGTPVDCDDQNVCTTDSCAAGICANTAVGDDADCGDGDACNGAETCQLGGCAPGTAMDCGDLNT
ncbi:MAG: hypothetical protein ACI9WU_004988, partial [Myxococcota bacterium]